MTDANANAGADVITFKIAGTPPYSIMPASSLPVLTEEVIIDGRTQPGYAGRPLVEINGASAGEASGIRSVASGCAIRGLAINRFQLEGVRVEGSSNTVTSCHIGCDTTGMFARPNGGIGILVAQTSGALIGGSEAGEGNVVSGNTGHAIYLLGGGSHTVAGNVVGLNSSAVAALPNGGHGVVLYDTFDNVIGGSGQGERNVLAGNTGSGITVVGSSLGNSIRGNYIGTDGTGRAAAGNAGDGITLLGGAGTRVGGVAAGDGNLIGANLSGGVYIAAASSNNAVCGNLVGVDETGKKAMGNRFSGIMIHGSTGNEIGGRVAGARNVISGNRQDGITLTNATFNRVQGNYVGVSADGSVGVANEYDGISLLKSTGNTIGGSDATERNVVSGNAYHGIDLAVGSSDNVVRGNLVGTDATGSAALANSLNGIKIESARNMVGGLGCGNLVSGNKHNGILLMGSGSFSNAIYGNLVGTTAAGTAALMNAGSGILISNSRANEVGSTKPGLGNVISGNGSATTGTGGINLSGTGSTENLVVGNMVGTDPSGRSKVGNMQEGIYVYRANSNVISANVISGNGTIGLSITNANATRVEGNVVGFSADRSLGIPNHFHGVEIHAGTAATRVFSNYIAHTTVYTGVRVRDGATNNLIDACRIYSNGAMEIDLGAAGHNANDSGDADQGGNFGQNHPDIVEAIGGNGVTIKATLNSRSSRTYRIQFYASEAGDASGYGGGQRYLGEQTVTTSPFSGLAQVTAFLPVHVAAGEVITATATDNLGNTSEFSAPMAVVALPILQAKIGTGGTLELSWAAGGPAVVVKQTSHLTPPIEWQNATAVPQLVGGRWTAIITPEPGVEARYYALGMP